MNELYGIPKGREESYLQYLKGVSGIVDGPIIHDLFTILQDIPFRWSLPKDGNRNVDGISLRVSYGCDCDPGMINCTVLELLIGLSLRIEDIMHEPELGNRVDEWLMELINNMDLVSAYMNFGVMAVLKNVDIFLDRGYNRAGHGGAFPLLRAAKDQRRAELWYQMNTYLIEKYHFID